MEKQKWYLDEPFKAFWEKGYRDKLISTMGGPSIEVFEMLPFIKPGYKVIDLGCGEGRNALFLAQHGCEVTAVDISPSGIEKVNIAAKALGVEIRTIVCDLNDYVVDDKYDVVLAHTSLHFLSRKSWRKLLSDLKESTNPNGFHSLTVFLSTPKYPIPEEIMAAGHKLSFAIGELKEFYNNWEIIRYDSYLKQDQHPGIDIHSHYTEKILCRKNYNKDTWGKDYIIKSLYSNQPDLSLEKFNKIRLGDSEDTIISICGEPDNVNEVDFGSAAMGAKNILVKEYFLKDMFYGKTGFQLINNEVRGKYLYDSEPVRVLFNEKGLP